MRSRRVALALAAAAAVALAAALVAVVRRAPAGAAARPAIDAPDFERVYLSRPPPVLLLADDLDDPAAWEVIRSEGTAAEVSAADAPGGRGLRVRYDFPSPGFAWWVIRREVAPVESRSVGVSLRVRFSRPGQTLEVKVADEDGSLFARFIETDTSYLEWREVVVPPDGLAYQWGGADSRLGRIRHVEIAANENGVPGPGEVLLDDLRIYEDRSAFAECALSQVGYHPGDRKRAVVRVVGETLPAEASFSVEDARTGRRLLEGRLEPTETSPWSGRYFVADFTRLADEGTFRLRLDLGAGRTLVTKPFEIAPRLLSRRVTPLVLSFLRYMRCGEDRCHPQDPIPGGYHDTHYDIGKRMWSLTHVILGLTLTAEQGLGPGDADGNGLDDSVDELLYALDFAFRVQLPGGGVGSAGVGHDTFVDNTKHRFEQDTHPRVLDPNPAVHTTCYYAASLARAATLLRGLRPRVAAEALERARQAAGWLRREAPRFRASHEHGGYVYARTELFRATGDTSYLEGLLPHIEAVLALQDLDPAGKEDGIRGEFHFAPDRRGYSDHQYKFFEYNLEIPLGLANVREIFDPASREWLLATYVLEAYQRLYVEPMCARTPYRQVAHGMEPDGDRLRVAFFPPPTQAWTGAHGMNVDHFAHGYLAMRVGYLDDDPACEELADDQMQWVLGTNPLRYCMVSGAGHNNPAVWSMLHGKGGPYDGEIPNGIVGDRLPFPKWVVVFSSGENWLPHDAYALVLSALLDADATLTGRVAGAAAGRVEVLREGAPTGATPVAFADVGADGRFGPAALPAGAYVAAYDGPAGRARRRVVLLSGEREETLLDPAGAFDLRLAVTSSGAETAAVEVAVVSGCDRPLRPSLLIRTFDGDAAQGERLEVPLAPGETARVERIVRFRSSRPVLVACGRSALLVAPER